MTALFGDFTLQGRERSEQVPCRRGSIEGEPFRRLYEKGAPFGAPLIQAISEMVPPQSEALNSSIYRRNTRAAHVLDAHSFARLAKVGDRGGEVVYLAAGACELQDHRLGCDVEDERAEFVGKLHDRVVELTGRDHLDKDEFAAHAVLFFEGGDVDGLFKFGRLFDDLIEGILVTSRGDRDARDLGVVRRRDRERIDVEASPAEQTADP